MFDMPLEDLLPDVIQEKALQLENAEFQPTKQPAVYVIYNARTKETLYMGETKNLFQRITDHHLGPNETDLRRRIEDDPELDIPTTRGKF